MRFLLAAVLALGPAALGAAPLISEVMFHPPANAGRENVTEEWIELHNPGPSSVNLNGWTLGGVAFTFPSVALPVGAYLVVAADVATFQSHHPGVANVIGGWTGELANRGQALLLRNPQGQEVDRVEYADGGDWATRRPGPDDQGHTGWIWESPASGGGKSLEVRNRSFSNSSGQNWRASQVQGGTPGEQNSVFSTNIPPLVEEVSHHPAVPGPNDLVLVRARLTDDFQGARGVVRYRASSGNPGAFFSAAMNDDGLRGDERARDGIHTALLPEQPAGTVVEFYIEAFDAIQSRTWPGPADETGARGANLLYQVDTEEHSGREPLYRLILSAPELTEFFAIPYEGPELGTNAQFNATFIGKVGDKFTTIYQCGLRLRGDESRDRYPRNMRVILPPPLSWQGQTEFDLNSQFTYNQILGSLFYREAGLPAFECKAVQVRMNGFNHASRARANQGQPYDRHYGHYAHVEPFNCRFKDKHFPLDEGGNLYHRNGEGTSWQHFPDSTDLAADYSATGWKREHSSAVNDWSDLHEFLGVMTNADGPGYLEAVEAVLDLDSWLRALAVSTILTNSGESLFTGHDKDYALYCEPDGKFKLLPHDLDSVLGQGAEGRIAESDLPHTIFDFIENGASFEQLETLFEQPEVLRRYHRILRDLLDGPFEENRINALIDDALRWTPPLQAALAKEFLAARRADILATLDRPLTASSPLAPFGNHPTTTTGSAPLGGTFSPLGVDSVFVNGVPATLDHRAGTWSFTADGLFPGINRITVEERNAAGELLSSAHLDIYYHDGSFGGISGTLARDTVLDAASGPWHVASTLIVPDGLTLTIEPGTTLFFDPGAGIVVESGGTLVCAGRPYERIRLTISPGLGERWEGIDLTAPGGGPSSTTPNVIAYTDMEYGDGQGESIRLSRSRLTLDHVSWENIDDTVLEVFSPQLEVRDCVFPSVPSSEAIRCNTLSGDDFFNLRRSTFVASTGYEDLVCINGGRRPGPIFAAYDNIFNGSTDDCLDLNDCDAHVEGNIFRNVHPPSPRNSTSNAIATDDDANITAVRNLFFDVDHAILLKDESTSLFENNTVVRATMGAINFDEPLGNVEPGMRIDMHSNIFVDCAEVLLNEDSTPLPTITGSYNILPAQDAWIGAENFDGDPYLADLEAGPQPGSNWAPLPGSPALASGRNGLDRGALVPSGAQAFGLPPEVTFLTSLTLPVDGPGITHYRWRLVSDLGGPGAWSADTPISLPLSLNGLTPDTYHLDLLARDSAGSWQDPAAYNSTRPWTVNPNLVRGVVLSELFVVTSPADDEVELYNGTNSAVSLDGWYLSDDPQDPRKESLSGLSIPAGAHLSLPTSKVPGLSSEGETLFLYDGGVLIDSVSWGPQAAGFSIGRLPATGPWTLTVPTLGSLNRRAGIAPACNLKINEWLATASVRYSHAFVELFNPNDAPIPLGDLWISDTPDDPLRHRLPALSFVGPGGFISLPLTGALAVEPDQIALSPNPFQSHLVVSDSFGNPIDQISITCLHPDITEGRQPDGSSHLRTFDLGTPGRSNNRPASAVATTVLPFLSADWKFLDNDDPPAAWVDPDYDDRSWEVGPAPLGRETTPAQLPEPPATDPSTVPAFDYVQGRKNYYFRRTFDFAGDPEMTTLRLTTYIDDGAVFYLNGAEIYRHNMPLGVLDANTWARNTIDNATIEGPFDVPRGRLQRGTNTLAVVTYQVRATSSDIIFDCELEITESVPAPPSPEELAMQILLDNLRISEVMFDAPDGDHGDYIEVRNISETTTLNLLGVRFTQGVEFVFPDFTLAPGESAVVIRDFQQFRTVHGFGPRVVDTYKKNLDDEGEVIALTLPEPFEVNIQTFTYSDQWFEEANGFGKSLELIDPSRPLATWNEPSAWIASHALHGSPSADNSSQSYAAWIAALGPLAGEGHAIDYALGLDATTLGSLVAFDGLELKPGANLSTTFLIPALAPPDVTFRLQSSVNMKTWTTHASRVGNGPWTGSHPAEEARPPSGMGLVILRLSDTDPVLFTRLLVEINP